MWIVFSIFYSKIDIIGGEELEREQVWFIYSLFSYTQFFFEKSGNLSFLCESLDLDWTLILGLFFILLIDLFMGSRRGNKNRILDF